MAVEEAIIDMHDTWLSFNPIQGCSNNCKYCLLQGTTGNKVKPSVKVDAPLAVNMLINHKYYDSKIPICLLPGTDPFLNKYNTNYIIETLNLFIKYNICNPIVIITKCFIPNNVLDLLEYLINKGIKVVVYLSYSSLDKNFEPNINHDDILLNFKNLSNRKIPIIHYYRPLLKENSSIEDINEILDIVSKYTNISVVTGLKVREDFIDKIDFLDIVKSKKEECLKSSGLWPKSAYKYFFENYNHKQNIFQTNYCALAQALEIPCKEYYGTFECANYNHCSKNQRNICSLSRKNIVSNEQIIALIKKLGYNTKNIEIIRDKNNIILVNSKLNIADAAYLTRILETKISLKEKLENDVHFSSSITNSKPLIY